MGVWDKEALILGMTQIGCPIQYHAYPSRGNIYIGVLKFTLAEAL